LNEAWTLLEVLNWTKGYLAGKGVENARLESEWLLCAATGLDRVGLYVNYEKPLSDSELKSCREMVARRALREPLQYILGTQEFCGLDFEVNPAVLIPRHDTEVLVAEALKKCGSALKILDVGVGSGCIAVALARALPAATIWGVDSSPAALEVARRNAQRHGAAVHLLPGSLFETLPDERFDLIVSNPPYIPTADIAALQPEVRDYEPHDALDGGPDGLDCYRALVPQSLGHLAPGGWLMVEVGIGQAAHVKEIFSQSGRFTELFIAPDPSGTGRVVGGKIT